MSSEPKFTPGPWVAKTDRWRTQFAVRKEWNGGGVNVALAVRTETTGWDQYEANSHLIAAAPDLYAAAKEALYRMEKAWGTCEGKDDGDCLCARCELEKALAKARGEEAK